MDRKIFRLHLSDKGRYIKPLRNVLYWRNRQAGKDPELRIETIVPEGRLKKVVREMLAAHPYEEVAYDLYPLKNQGDRSGLGRVGRLLEPMPLAAFAEKVKADLGLEMVRMSGDPKRLVSKVALCGGSAMALLEYAVQPGADVYLTGMSDIMEHWMPWIGDRGS